MSSIAHISYSGVGGLAEVALSLLSAAQRNEENEDKHIVGFYGVEQLADRYIDRCESLDLDYHYVERRGGLDLKSAKVMSQWLRENRPDVVITHMTQTFIPFIQYWLTNPKAKLVVVEHHSNALKGVQDWTLTLINHWLAHATVYLTDQYRDQVKRKLKFFLFNKRVHVISNGLDLDVYTPLENREFEKKNLTIGMQGRMTESKDYPTLFYAFAKFRDSAAADANARLEIAGDGPMRVELEKLANALGIADAVDFLGMIPQEEMIRRLQNWDIFVLSTLGETMSRALMEAQACGIPLVASDVSGVSAAIDHGRTGMLVPARDPDALATTLRSLADQPEVRREMAEVSRKHAVESFSVDQSWKRYREVVGKVLAET